MIEVLDPGRFTSVQDRGRPGLERFGVPPGGVADWFAAAAANQLVGNSPDAALLEFTATGPTLSFNMETTIAITGGQCVGMRGLVGAHNWQASRIDAGTVLELGRIAPGFRSYLTVRGGIDVPMVLDSRSLCARGGFGGGFGRPLRKGDRLAVGTHAETAVWSGPWPSSHRPPLHGPWEVRVIAGPHLDQFETGALDRLTATACQVTPALDRMGMHLRTPGLRLQPREILTTPMTAGAIQVTPSGELILLLTDHPTTGGYPVIGTVITADLPLMAQARPGDTVRFRSVELAEAARAWGRLSGWLAIPG